MFDNALFELLLSLTLLIILAFLISLRFTTLSSLIPNFHALTTYLHSLLTTPTSLAALNPTNATLLAKIASLEQKLRAKEDAELELTMALKCRGDEMNDMIEFMDGQRTYTKNLQDILHSTANALAKTGAELDEVRGEVGGMKGELGDTRNELVDTQDQLTDTHAELTNTRAELSNTQSKLTSTQNELAKTSYLLDDAHVGLQRQQESIAEQNEAFGIALDEISMLDGDIVRLKEENGMMRGQLEDVMRAWERGEMCAVVLLVSEDE